MTKGKSIKRFFSMVLVLTLILQSVDITALIEAYADTKPNYKNQDYSNISSMVYIDESTDEILNLIEHGLNLDTYFDGELVKGITKDDLIKWKNEGKDIKEIINERANERTEKLSLYNNDVSNQLLARASASGDGKYYLTICSEMGSGNVSSSTVFNPKTGQGGLCDTWYIELGNEPAVCLTFGANASVNKTHSYAQGSISALKNNAYFKGGQSYPIEEYLRGVCYAYERLRGRGLSQGFDTNALDSELSEILRKFKTHNPNNYAEVLRGMVSSSGQSMAYSILQIIIWQISCGTFDANNLTALQQEAYGLFTQMYPLDEYGIYAACCTYVYEYFALCAKECASGKYASKFAGTDVTYWAVQGANSQSWQDFVTWSVPTPVPVNNKFRVQKLGKVLNAESYPNAKFNIYSDSGYTNKIGEFTTDNKGQAYIDKIVSGIYYLREINAPKGTIKRNDTITLTVYDDVDSVNISNEEYYNGAFFRKYDSTTQEAIKTPGKYALYENVNGNYMKVCDFSFIEKGFTNSKGVVIPDYSYVISSTSMTYHNNDGTELQKITASNFYYTTVNQGKFKIVEEAAPSGYKLDTNGKEFTMNMSSQGYLNDFTSYSKGLKDDAYTCGIELKKYDTLSGEELATASFKIQENINNKLYDVGMLVYDENNKVYKTSATQTYIFRNSSGSVVKSVSGTDTPLRATSANQGRYYIVETNKPNENYTDLFTKNIIVKPSEDGYIYKYDNYNHGNGNAAYNIGKKIRVITSKYDAITKELLPSSNVATMTLYEYNSYSGEWQILGNMEYDSDNNQYVLDGNKFYTPHIKDGSDSTASVGATYKPGYLYYTSVNKGQFKVVETKAPVNYLLGMLDVKTLDLKVYEKTFNIDETVTDGQVIDFTDKSNAAYDTGIPVNLKLEKYDTLSGDRISTGDAVFTVYENINNEWYTVGNLIYNTTDNIYTSKGMTISLHNSNGDVIYTEKSANALYYTTANQGKYKVVETKAPDKYLNDGFKKEFNITTDSINDEINLVGMEKAAADTGISGTVKVAKYDSITKELVSSEDAEFTVYEKVNDKWFSVGKLEYDSTDKTYNCKNATFTFHDKSGKVIETKNISEFESGKLYYTTVNKGQFKVVETKAPANYSNDGFENEFKIETQNETKEFSLYDKAAKDTGIWTTPEVVKYDSITTDEVEAHNALFIVQEYINNKWLDVANLSYDINKKVYNISNNLISLHNVKEDIIYTNNDGKLYYTTANQGRYRIIEKKAPDNYVLLNYEKEFNVTDNKNSTIKFTDNVNGAKDIGISGTVELSKYDAVTKELVKYTDAEFTLYEKIGNTWYKSGILRYDDSNKTYNINKVVITYHDKSGKVVDTKNASGFESGKLYYTTANKGQFKVVETKAPKYYTLKYINEIPATYQFSITKNGQSFTFNKFDNAVKNYGYNAIVKINKYDSITKAKVNIKDTEFVIQECVNESWLDVSKLTYDEENSVYTTLKTKVSLHNSKKEIIHTNADGKLYYTTANQGKYRIVEIKAPTNYTLGSKKYIREFNVLDAINNVIDLTKAEDSPADIGISGVVKVSKYDSITKELVKTDDAEFTVYEKVNDKWLSVGILSYNQDLKEYNCDNVSFTFHDNAGNEVNTENITDFENGKLYYTTANAGQFKVVETKAPAHYMIDGFEKEFNIAKDAINGEVSFNDEANAAYDTGVNGEVKLIKADSLTGEAVSGAKFTLQEWSENNNTWLSVGELIDNKDGNYITEGMKIKLHTGNDTDVIETNKLLYTSQNLGKYRIVETKAPAGYLNDMYVSDILSIENEDTVIELTDDKKATDTPIRVSISKKSITNGKEISGATLIIKDSSGNTIDKWVTDGTEHILAAIPAGKYTLIEERAAEGYIIANSIDFEVKETAEIQKVVMYDEEVKGQVIIEKTDKSNGNKLSGAVFEIRDENDKVIETITTNSNGYAKSGQLDFGMYGKDGSFLGSKTYKIIEIKAPNGYEIDSKPIEFKFEYIDDTTPVVTKTISITNKKIPPVKTGDILNIMPLVLLILSIVTAGITYFKKRRVNQYN